MLLLLLGIGLYALPAVAEPEIRYRATVTGIWSAESHPQDYPATAHFSPPVGGTHNGSAIFWEPGGLASPGIELMAEAGATGVLGGEILDEAALGNAFPQVWGAPGMGALGSRNVNFTTTASFSKLTLVTMIAPSPDWFAGVGGLELLVDGRWQDDVELLLGPYDAGTDSGISYTSSNFDTNPQEPISKIVTPPLAQNGVAPPVIRLTIAIRNVDGLQPYGDEDGDGLTNLREAELGTDPLEPDSDFDGTDDGEDNCPALSNPLQTDDDGDTRGNACDNCDGVPNSDQTDLDGDGEGDACDGDDGLLRFGAIAAGSVSWHDEPAFDAFNLYRGDLSLLSGGGSVTQDPALVPLADRVCGLTTASTGDGVSLFPGEGVFFLVTGESAGVEGSAGEASDGSERPNGHACPD